MQVLPNSVDSLRGNKNVVICSLVKSILESINSDRHGFIYVIDSYHAYLIQSYRPKLSVYDNRNL